MALHADGGVEEDAIDSPAPKMQSKGRDGGRKRGAATAVGDVQDEIDEEEEYVPLVTITRAGKANFDTGIGSPRRSAPRQSPPPLKRSNRSRPRRPLPLPLPTGRPRLKPKVLQRKPPKQRIGANLEEAPLVESRRCSFLLLAWEGKF